MYDINAILKAFWSGNEEQEKGKKRKENQDKDFFWFTIQSTVDSLHMHAPVL